MNHKLDFTTVIDGMPALLMGWLGGQHARPIPAQCALPR